jgi:hypothetical protein
MDVATPRSGPTKIFIECKNLAAGKFRREQAVLVGKDAGIVKAGIRVEPGPGGGEERTAAI